MPKNLSYYKHCLEDCPPFHCSKKKDYIKKYNEIVKRDKRIEKAIKRSFIKARKSKVDDCYRDNYSYFIKEKENINEESIQGMSGM